MTKRKFWKEKLKSQEMISRNKDLSKKLVRWWTYVEPWILPVSQQTHITADIKQALFYHYRLAFPSYKLLKGQKGEQEEYIPSFSNQLLLWLMAQEMLARHFFSKNFPPTHAVLDCNLEFVEQFPSKLVTTLGVLTWSLLIHFWLPMTFRCFQHVFLIFSYLKPTYNICIF